MVGQTLWGLVALRHAAGIAFLKGKLDGLCLFRRVRKSTQATQNYGLRHILRESENEIHDLQRQTGYDLYWRLYFALT